MYLCFVFFFLCLLLVFFSSAPDVVHLFRARTRRHFEIYVLRRCQILSQCLKLPDLAMLKKWKTKTWSRTKSLMGVFPWPISKSLLLKLYLGLCLSKRSRRVASSQCWNVEAFCDFTFSELSRNSASGFISHLLLLVFRPFQKDDCFGLSSGGLRSRSSVECQCSEKEKEHLQKKNTFDLCCTK